MPNPIRNGNFARRFTPAQFEARMRKELQLVADLKAQGVDTQRLEHAIHTTKVAHDKGHAIRELDLQELIPASRPPVHIPTNVTPGTGNVHVVFAGNKPHR